MESAPPPRRATVAGFLGPALLVVELQGVACANPTAIVGDSLTGIVDTAGRNLAGAGNGGVHLLAAYAMDRRPCDSKVAACRGGGGDQDDCTGDTPMRPDDVCTLLCVGALRSVSTSHWVALDMTRAHESTGPDGARARRGRKWFAIGAAQATLLGCFTRHATINSHGAIDRNAAAAADCETCARTWRDFRPLFSRPRPRQRVNAARLAAVTAASLDARRWFRSEASLVDVLCAGAVALREVAPRMDPADARLVRAERALATLGAQIEAALAVCLWADRFGASAALAIMAEADARAATTLPEHPPRLRQPADVLESVVSVAVAAGLITARANLAAATALVMTGAEDDDNASATAPSAVVPAELTSSWISSVLSDRGEADMGDWASRATAIFTRVRQAVAARKAHTQATVSPLSPTATSDTTAATTPCDRPTRQQQQQQQQRQDAPPVSTHSEPASAAPCPTNLMRCAGTDCRSPGRRIASGCVISAHCTADCRVTFHRACWEGIEMTLGDGAPCPTPDCWGEIVRVTSARWRAVDRPPRVLWQTPSPPCGSAASVRVDPSHDPSTGRRPAVPRGHTALTDGGLTEHSIDHESDEGALAAYHDSTEGDGGEQKRDGHIDATPSHGQGIASAAAAPTGGIPYHKNDPSREPSPGRRKRPRNRTGRRQRCRLARQQHDRLLALAGLADPPDKSPETEAEARPRNERMNDDALWPSFFVPDPV
ncbi:hypothetical protein pdul_cds_1026 [Pandoravirus dulcis]|uniref:Uncharacterized protein n=1 Tax=Pandoravirus dulcis TaxID=1349409 RepID=S4VSB8_9VIRU|nr:hypothetical protein pdul_cds_1026 [Pandoravirus dulcis]AGO83298.1 hypothetical protein pdul_cds_1026 [Pandoravirus dulcis]